MLRRFLREVFPKIISAKAHSVIDYGYVGGNLIAAAIMRKNNRAASSAAFGLAFAALLNAVLTDYPLGVFRVYSFRTHGVVDYGISAAAEMVPKMMEFTEHAERKYFRVLSASGLLVAELSNYGETFGSVRTKNHLSMTQRRSATD